jgi:hypothetical protein
MSGAIPPVDDPGEPQTIALGVAKVKGLADTVISRAINRYPVFDEALQRAGEGRTVWIEDRRMVESGGSRRGWRASTALPCVEANVVVISVHSKKCGLRAKSLCHLEAEDILVEDDGPGEISHLQVNMADANT